MTLQISLNFMFSSYPLIYERCLRISSGLNLSLYLPFINFVFVCFMLSQLTSPKKEIGNLLVDRKVFSTNFTQSGTFLADLCTVVL